jgi:hypothetical protein
MASYKYITPTDVDRFIQIPDTLEVDARSLVLTVEEDTLQKYDKYFQITDYVIYCEAAKDKFFSCDASGNSTMDWKYKVVQTIDASGAYVGPQVADAHDPLLAVDASSNPVLAEAIIASTVAKEELGLTTAATRFVHYKQCNRFFKYSFKVGDAAAIPAAAGRAAQLYAVYLDKESGAALPYWATVAGSGNDQTAEVRNYFYADFSAGTVLGDIYPDPAGSLVSTLDGSGAAITVVCPADPEFLESKGSVVGGNLVYSKDASGNLAIRRVGDTAEDPSGNNLTNYTSANFVEYTTDANRALLMYWVVLPLDAAAYQGDELYAAWSSVAAGGADGLCAVRDVVDASGVAHLADQPATADQVKEAQKFTWNKAMAAATPLSVKDTFAVGALAPTAAPRMYMPVSKFIVVHEHPTEPDVHNNGVESFDVPFAYEVCNATGFGGDSKKTIMGGRIMQMVSNYLFDGAADKEMAYFPFLLNESRALTDKIVDALTSKIVENSSAAHEARSFVLNQIVVKHGRKFFDEYAVLNELTGEKVGRVWDVLSKLPELFLFFTTTVKMTVSNRSKDDVEVIRLVEVPVVVRIFDAVV